MLVNREAHPRTSPRPGVGGGLVIYDVSDPEPAARDHVLAVRRRGRAPLHLRRALRLHLARDGRLRRQHRDDPRSRRSRAAAGSRALVDAGAVDGGRRDAVVVGAPSSLPSSDPRGQPALRQLLARRLRDPRHRGHERSPRFVSGLDWSPPFITPTHTALPRAVPAPRPPRSCWSPTRTWPSSSRGRRRSSGWWTSPTSSSPVPFSSFQVEGVDGTPQPEFTGCHQPCETITGTEIPGRLVRLRAPHRRHRQSARAARGRALPAGRPRRARRASRSNDVFVDDRGLIYLIDRGRGLHILERT